MTGYEMLPVTPGPPVVPFCGRCYPERKPGKSYALRDPLPADCPIPPALRFSTRRGGCYWMCDDCAREGARWFVEAPGVW